MKVSDLTKGEVTGGKRVRFEYYRAGELWYRTESGLLFPVPVSDVGDATFLAEDKALLFMRYIRKWLESLEPAALSPAEMETAKRLSHRESCGAMFGEACCSLESGHGGQHSAPHRGLNW